MFEVRSKNRVAGISGPNADPVGPCARSAKILGSTYKGPADLGALDSEMFDRVIAALPDLLTGLEIQKMVNHIEWIHAASPFTPEEKNKTELQYIAAMGQNIVRDHVVKIVRDALGLSEAEIASPAVIALIERILAKLSHSPAFRACEDTKQKMFKAARAVGQIRCRREKLENEPLDSQMPFSLLDMKLEQIEALNGFIGNYRDELQLLKADYAKAIEKFKKPIREALQHEGFSPQQSQGVTDQFTQDVIKRHGAGKPMTAQEAGQHLVDLAQQKKPLSEAAQKRLAQVVEHQVKTLETELKEVLDRTLHLLVRVMAIFLNVLAAKDLRMFEKKIHASLKKQKDLFQGIFDRFQNEMKRWIKMRQKIFRF